MTRIPGAANVDRALRVVKMELKTALGQVNREAGKRLSKGTYAGAEVLVEIAKAVDGFRAEVQQLHARWKTIGGRAGAGSTKADRTALWKYYKPILHVLDTHGGSARLPEIRDGVEQRMGGDFLEGDLETMARGRPRWQGSIRRARRKMVEQGLLKSDTGLSWQLSAAGRRAARGQTT